VPMVGVLPVLPMAALDLLVLRDHQMEALQARPLDHLVLRDHSLTLDLCSTRCLLRVERRDPHPIPSPTCRRRLDP